MRKTTIPAFFFLGLLFFVSPLVSGQEENGTEPEKKEKKFMIGFQVPIFDFVYLETTGKSTIPDGTGGLTETTNKQYTVTYDLTVEPAANMIFGFKVLEQWWFMAVFGFDLHFSGLTESKVRAGLGTRVDFPFRNGVGFCGIFLEYAYWHSPQEDPSTTHGINFLGFGGAEYLAIDFFGIGAQVQAGYLWYRPSEHKERDIQGAMLILMGSMSFYF